jgi:hypothetical protein
MAIQKPNRTPRPKRITLSGRPHVARPARPSLPPRPSPRNDSGGSVLPNGHGTPHWGHGLEHTQRLLRKLNRPSVGEEVRRRLSPKPPVQSARNKGWQTRREKYGKSGRKT